MKNLWKAFDSALRAFIKQWKRMRTLQRNALKPDPLEYKL